MTMSISKRSSSLQDIVDTRNCLQLIFGRQALSHHEILFYCRDTVVERISRMIENMEFRVEVETPISCIGFASTGRFMGEPPVRFVDWLKNKIPLSEASRGEVENAESWRTLLFIVWSDSSFATLFQDKTISDQRIRLLKEGLRRVALDANLPLSKRFSCQLQSLQAGVSLISVGLSAVEVQPPETEETTYSVREMIRVRPWQKGYVSAEDDPQLIFPSLNPGIYHLRMRILYEHTSPYYNPDYTQLFFDFGGGYTEEQSFKFTICNSVVAVEAMIDIQTSVKTVRLDPSVGPAVFKIEYISLNQI